MHSSLALPPGDAAIDDLGDALSGLLRSWACDNRAAATHGCLLDVLVLIGERERRLSELAELRNVDQSVISRQVAELQEKGLLSRRPDPADRRAGLVRLTAEGLVLLERARARRRDWLRGALALHPDLDARAASGLFRTLAADLSRAARPEARR